MATEVNVEALVLRRSDSGESDRRLVLLARGIGLVTAVAKGARKSGSRLGSISEPLVYANFHLAGGKRTPFITQAERRALTSAWRRDFDRLAVGLCLAELTSAVAQPEREDDDLLDLLLAAIHALAGEAEASVVLAWFAVRSLAIEGLVPSWVQCPATGTELVENPAWIAPSWGGLVDAAADPWPTDAYPVRAEALIGLHKLGERECPPARMKFVREALIALGPVWLAVAGRSLPAFHSFLQSVGHADSPE